MLQIFILSLPAVLSQFEIMPMQGEPVWTDDPNPLELNNKANQWRPRKVFRKSGDTRRQFAQMSLQPDMAFGDVNDRFDLSGVYKHHKHRFREGDYLERRRFLPQASRRSGAQRHQPDYRRDEDWLEDMEKFAENDHLDKFANRPQDYRRYGHRQEYGDIVAENSPAESRQTEREIVLNYALPIKIRVQDLVNGTFITGINIL